jgi:hypothetical protein
MSKKTTDKIPDIIETIHAKHTFSQDELIEVSRSLGRTCTRSPRLNRRRAQSKDFASRIETEEIMRDSLVDKVSSGYEFRPTECIVVFDPKNRSKDYMRRNGDGEPGEFVERREMTTADFQLALPVQETTK